MKTFLTLKIDLSLKKKRVWEKEALVAERLNLTHEQYSLKPIIGSRLQKCRLLIHVNNRGYENTDSFFIIIYGVFLSTDVCCLVAAWAG